MLDRTITLYRGETKSGEPRLVKMTNDVFVLLQACISGKTPEQHVFTRKGEPIVDTRDAWAEMCEAAGVSGLLFHDGDTQHGETRNTGARCDGDKRTRAVFDRYNIVGEDDLAEAARKIEAGRTTAVQDIEVDSGYSLVKVEPSYTA